MLRRGLLLALATLAVSSSLFGQSDILPIGGAPPFRFASGVVTSLFHTVLRPVPQAPPITMGASVSVDIRLHRADRQPAYAVDFIANYKFAGPVMITGFHIRRGQPNGEGQTVLDSGISVAKPQMSPTGAGSISVQMANTITPAFAAAISDFQTNPSAYFADLDIGDSPSVLRGQLGAAQQVVVMGVMSPANEVPAVTGTQSGVGTAVATITRNPSGVITSAEVMFDVNYQFDAPVTLTGLHIHSGSPSVAGPVILNSGLTNLPAAASGNVRLTNEMDVTNPAVVAALEALFADPSNYYINIHTTIDPNGAMRAQLARASRSSMQVGLGTNRQFGLPGGADGLVTWDVLRSNTGDLLGAMVTFDIDYFAFTPNTPFTNLSSDGASVPVSGANAISTGMGQGNIYAMVTVGSQDGLNAIAHLLQTLEGGVSLETASQAVSGSLLTGVLNISGHLEIDGIENAAGDPTVTAVAPGSLIALYGSFPLNPVDVTGLFQPWPTSLNNAWVTIGDRRIPLGYTSRGQINALVPPDIMPGKQNVQFWVKSDDPVQSDYRSVPFTLNIAAQAPAIFVASSGPAIVHANGELVSGARPAVGGELVRIYATGIAPGREGNFTPVSVIFGSQMAMADSVNMIPGVPGVEAVAVRAPLGFGSGEIAVQLKAGDAVSNSVRMPLE